MMKQLQLFKYATLALIILNLLLVSFFFITRPRPQNDRGPQGPPPMGKETSFQERVIEVLNLDRSQHDTFLQLVKQHRESMRSINDRQAGLLEPYFKSVMDGTKASDTDGLLQEFKDLEAEKIESTLRHFQDIKLILNEEQIEDFPIFMNRALEMIMPNNNQPPRPRDF